MGEEDKLHVSREYHEEREELGDKEEESSPVLLKVRARDI